MTTELDTLRLTLELTDNDPNVGIGVSLPLAAELVTVYDQVSDPDVVENYLQDDLDSRELVLTELNQELNSVERTYRELNEARDVQLQRIAVVRGMMKLVQVERAEDEG